MNAFAIPCTKEQTRKALELEAPIEIASSLFELMNRKYFKDGCRLVIIPTTEEIIGWLEDQGIQISIMFSYRVSPKRWNYDLDNNNIILFEHNSMGYPSRKEATLAAIDAALEYLNKKK